MLEATPLGRYLLRERLARGGMGEVFKAVALGAGGFEKAVVVKRILPQLGGDQLLADMFVDEARLMSRLVHPNIVQVLDFGQGLDGDYFLVMELVEGVDLAAFSHYFEDRGFVPVDVALYVTSQILRGLGHAHEKAAEDGHVLVHRDVSPGNVLLSKVGEVKVADFGVALVGRDTSQEGRAGEAGARRAVRASLPRAVARRDRRQRGRGRTPRRGRSRHPVPQPPAPRNQGRALTPNHPARRHPAEGPSRRRAATPRARRRAAGRPLDIGQRERRQPTTFAADSGRVQRR